jgi:hypothetical protein
MTLTTYADLAFNAPFYRKLGFHDFLPDENWKELGIIYQNECNGILGKNKRIAMIKNI